MFEALADLPMGGFSPLPSTKELKCVAAGTAPRWLYWICRTDKKVCPPDATPPVHSSASTYCNSSSFLTAAAYFLPPLRESSFSALRARRASIPTPAEYGEQADSWSKKLLDASPGSLSMVHGAVSPRGDFVLAGWQGSRHLVFDEQLEQVASVGPLCEYPDFAWFSTTGDLAAFNACSFYDGVSIAVPATALRGLDTAHHEKHPSVRVLDESARVYAAVARDDEFIIGDARGYLRAFDLRGLPRHSSGRFRAGPQSRGGLRSRRIAGCRACRRAPHRRSRRCGA